MSGQQGQSSSGLNNARTASTAQPSSSIGGMTPQSLNESGGRNFVTSEAGAGELILSS